MLGQKLKWCRYKWSMEQNAGSKWSMEQVIDS